MILKVFQVDKIACVQYTCSLWSSSQFFMQFLQCCLKFSIIVFFAVCVHVNHRRCNFAVSFECYDTEFIELMPHTWNSISLCEHTNEHFIQHESSSVVHILTVCLRYHELHLLYILAEEKYYFEFDSFL